VYPGGQPVHSSNCSHTSQSLNILYVTAVQSILTNPGGVVLDDTILTEKQLPSCILADHVFVLNLTIGPI